MKYFTPIIFILLSIALKKSLIPNVGEYYAKKWWIFLVLGILDFLFKIILFLMHYSVA